MKTLVDDLIRHGSTRRDVNERVGKYPCACDSGYRLTDNLLNEAQPDDASGGGMMMQHKALLPNLCNGLCLNYTVQRRVGEILDAWLFAGLRAMTPQTAAAAAVWHAHEETKFFFTDATGAAPVLDLARLANQAGIKAATVKRVIKELPLSKLRERGEQRDSTSLGEQLSWHE